MNQIYVPLASALVGGLIAACATLAAVWVQSSTQSKRDRLKLAAELAMQDYKLRMDLIEKQSQSVRMPPVSVFVHHQFLLLEAIHQGRTSKDDLSEIRKNNDLFAEALLVRAADEARKPEL